MTGRAPTRGLRTDVTAAQRLRLVLALGVVNLVLAGVALGFGHRRGLPTGPSVAAGSERRPVAIAQPTPPKSPTTRPPGVHRRSVRRRHRADRAAADTEPVERADTDAAVDRADAAPTPPSNRARPRRQRRLAPTATPEGRGRRRHPATETPTADDRRRRRSATTTEAGPPPAQPAHRRRRRSTATEADPGPLSPADPSAPSRARSAIATRHRRRSDRSRAGPCPPDRRRRAAQAGKPPKATKPPTATPTDAPQAHGPSAWPRSSRAPHARQRATDPTGPPRTTAPRPIGTRTGAASRATRLRRASARRARLPSPAAAPAARLDPRHQEGSHGAVGSPADEVRAR